MLKVIWSPEAKQDYWDNIDYLLEEFPVQVAQDFIKKVEHLISLLKQNNVNFKKTTRDKVFYVPVLKQITLFYKTQDNTIYLIRFWNNSKNPMSLKY